MSELLVEADQLQTYFPVKAGVFQKTVGHVKAVDGVSLQIRTGEIAGVVGESGCGKSTLGNSILGLVRPTGGTLRLSGSKLDLARPAAWDDYRRDYQVIFQDPNTSLNPRHTVFEILSEPLLVHGLADRNNVRAIVSELLRAVGLSPDYLPRYPHAFSGGQRQRLCIARAIALKPKLIICDEVTAALDVSVQAQIIQLLLKLRDDMGLALLFISHDLSVIRAVCSTVHVMYLGRIVESGSVEDVFRRPRHPYTAALLDSIPTLDRNRRPRVLKGEIPSPVNKPEGCAFHQRCPEVQDRCRVEEPLYENSVACFFPLSAERF